MTVKTRFAPSPTGMLHIGNARTALINMLYARHFGGKFILRIDDTDLIRSKKEYEEAIKYDLGWLGINWDETFSQSDRLANYAIAKEKLIGSGRLYECYETPEELEIKRKLQLSSGMPPIYDRAALKISEEQKEKYKNSGRKPHYRFKLEGDILEWEDLIKGIMHFEVVNISDPIVIREDGSMTYMISSTVDDIDSGITHVIRGEDHVTNTAIQVQLFEALNSKPPKFGHLSLVKAKDEKISKRAGGYEIASLREEKHIEAMSINSFFANIGTSNNLIPYSNISELIKKFDIKKFSLSATTYMPEDLERLNEKLIHSLIFAEAKERLKEMGIENISEEFWYAVRPNLKIIADVKIWWDICHNFTICKALQEDKEFLIQASELLPRGAIDETSWKEWTSLLQRNTDRNGKSLFMPIRKALTAMEHGPELAKLLPLIGRDEIINRLNAAIK